MAITPTTTAEIRATRTSEPAGAFPLWMTLA
jgi:hypothetical protein